MPADVVDDDTAAAVRTAWQTDRAVLPLLVNEPVQSGRLKSPQGSTYAVVSVRVGRSREYATCGVFHDFRTVKITAYGPKTSVVAALAAMGDVFNRDTVLVYPSGARFGGWWTTDTTLVEDPDTKSGLDVWQGILTAEVWSIRQRG